MDFDPKKNYYDILGVSEDASVDDIKKAFKKLAVQYHPDKKGGSKEKFQEVNEAYQILNNPQKKQQYDMMRKGGFSGGFGEGGFDFSGFGGGFGGFDIGDIVGDIFGGGFGGRTKANRPRKGEDIKYSMTISFEESYLGIEKTIKFDRRVMGSDVSEETCKTCNGSGAVAQQAQTPFGVMQVQSACPTCGGAGKIYRKDGKVISNGGLEKQTEKLDIQVPAGIKDGVYLKYSAKGNAGLNGGPMGDLFIKIMVKPSDIYERKGDDLYVTVELSIFDLVLGAEINVAHPTGAMKVKIPKGTQVSELIKVSGKGFGEGGIFGSKGNMYLKPKVFVPKKLSKEEEKLWKQLQEMK